MLAERFFIAAHHSKKASCLYQTGSSPGSFPRPPKPEIVVFVVCFFLCCFCSAGPASAFPFRAINVGDQVPNVSLTNYATQQKLSFDQLRGKHFIAIFWGADLPTKKKRAVKALRDIEKIKSFLNKHTIPVIAVNAQGDDPESIQEVITKSEFSYPVYVDKSQKAYGDLGIFIMPAILLVDKEGKAVTGMGYSREFVDTLKGEIEILLGEKTRAQVEQELHPQFVEKTAAEKASTRHLNMGLVMEQRAMNDSAIREFLEAIRLKPDLAQAHIELGCLYLDKGEIAKAQQAIEKGLQLEPDSLKALICQAKLKALHGKEEEAIQDLESLVFRQSRHPELRYELGALYEKKGSLDKAAAEYKKAYELMEHKIKLQSH